MTTGNDPDLVEAYGCNGEVSCAVYSAEDLDDIILADVFDELTAIFDAGFGL